MGVVGVSNKCIRSKNNSYLIKKLKELSILLACILPTLALANPEGGVVSAGSANISSPNPNTIQIQQATDRAVINWQSFNVAGHETVQFQQPNAGSITFNRINPSQGVSKIYGSIQAIGRIILSNPAGIWFGPTARVDVAGLIATTAGMTDEQFMAGQFKFMQTPNWNGAVINEGHIKAAEAGLVALIGSAVVNQGHIEANLGTVALGSGSEFTLNFSGNDLISFTVDREVLKRAQDQHGNEIADGVTHGGKIIANSGKVIVSTHDARRVLDHTINMQGYIQANSVAMKNGEIILSGGDGKIKVNGKLIVSGRNSGTKGGKVKISGKGQIDVTNVYVDTRSAIGNPGDFVMQAPNIYVTQDAEFVNRENATFINNTDIQNNLARTNITLESIANTNLLGDIYIYAPIEWSSSNVLTLDAAKYIYINEQIHAENGGLELSAAMLPRSITTGKMGHINLAKFNLRQGQWYQVKDNLPEFNITQDFQIHRGVNPAPVAQFIRAVAGDGSSVIPYKLVDIYGLQGIGSSIDTLGYHYSLDNDIDAASVVTWNNGAGFISLGNTIQGFTGSFNGNGHAIYNLIINNAQENSHLGLFGITNGASLNNIELRNFSIIADGNNALVGGLVGKAINTQIKNIEVDGIINTGVDVANSNVGMQILGGVVGYLEEHSSLTHAASAVAINSNLVTISNFGGVAIGGIVGFNAGAPILHVQSSGSIYVNARNITGKMLVGGIAGKTLGNITGANNSGTVVAMTNVGEHGELYLGGIAGFAGIGTIEDASNTSDVMFKQEKDNVITGTLKIGGLLGENRAVLNRVQNSGNVMSRAVVENGLVLLGGLVGENSNTINTANVNGNVWLRTKAEYSLLNIGGIAGKADLAAKLFNVVNTGNIRLDGLNSTHALAEKAILLGGKTMIGGLVGDNSGLLGGQDISATSNHGGINVHATINTLPDRTTTTYIGGLVGLNNRYAEVRAAISAGMVSVQVNNNDAQLFVGGAIGQNHGGIVTKVAAHAPVSVVVNNANGLVASGGLVGFNAGNVNFSYSKAPVVVAVENYANGVVVTGGLIGMMSDSVHGQHASLSNAYTLSHITVDGYSDRGAILTGGIVGANGLDPMLNDGFSNSNLEYIGGEIIDTLNGGYINVLVDTSTTLIATGGLLGHNDAAGLINNSYWDVARTNQEAAIGGGLGMVHDIDGGSLTANENTINLSSRAIYLNWDFNNTWGIVEGISYPYLKDFYPNGAPRILRGTAPVGNINKPVNLVSNGRFIDETLIAGDGSYYFMEQHDTLFDGALLLTYLSSASAKGNLIFTAPKAGGSLTGLTIYENVLQVGDTQYISLENADLARLIGDLNDADILYTAIGTQLMLGNYASTQVTLRTSPTTIFNVNGGVTFAEDTLASLDFAGPTTLTDAVVTNGDQNYAAPVIVWGNVHLVGNNITFNDRLDGVAALTVHAMNTLVFNQDVGHLVPLSSIDTFARNQVIRSHHVVTVHGQLYTNVTLENDAWFISHDGGLVQFTQGIQGNGHDLTIFGNQTLLSGLHQGLHRVTVIGNGNHNTLIVNTNDNQRWYMTGENEGNVQGLAGIQGGVYFANIQNIMGGFRQNNRVYMPELYQPVYLPVGAGVEIRNIPSIENNFERYVQEAMYMQYVWRDDSKKKPAFILAQDVADNIDELVGQQQLLDDVMPCVQSVIDGFGFCQGV